MRSNSRSSSRSRASGIPQWCGCGCRPVLCWSTTKANPNKPFFGCPNYNINGKRWCGLFVWADIGEEDLRGRVMSTVDGDQVRVDLAWRIGKIEAEVRTQKMYILGVGTNFRKLASLKDVAELAPCSGSTVIDHDGGVEDLLLVAEQGLLEQLEMVLLEEPEQVHFEELD
ncbi:hypothetical protein Ahy_A09g046260 [Arachis hypogaea]|uniref:Zinc finger GRF-type domain-containing protein n=1 Tax=Arachis hypogaea TaxID=3818 RepID=A0A445BP85_ARAHY|nr:hypothetical protein Ahy_A09g046260 [Arachis hypogaea]